MGILSTLRQGQFLPKHGSFWDSVLSGRIRARNPFNPIVNEVECVADKQHDIPTVEVVARSDPSGVGARVSPATDVSIKQGSFWVN